MPRSTAAVGLALALASLAAATSDVLRDLSAPPPGAVRFYLVRHGEAFSNLATPPAGLTAPELDHLTDRGGVQAAAAAGALAGRGIEAVVVSPANRTHETAEAIIAVLGKQVPVREDDRIGPLAMGRGPDRHHLTWDERKAEWSKGRDPAPPEGESLAQLRARVTDAMKDVTSAAGTGPHTVLFVTHSEVVEAMLGVAKGRLPLHGTAAGVHNASITVLDSLPDGRLRVVTENRVPWR